MGNGNLKVSAAFHDIERRKNAGQTLFDAWPTGGGQDNNGDPAFGQILLVLEVLIGGQTARALNRLQTVRGVLKHRAGGCFRVMGQSVCEEIEAMVSAPNFWTRRETLAALHVYLLLPFGQLHHRQPKITQLATWIGRTSNSVALKLVNLASLDPQVRSRGLHGMGNVSKLDQQIWSELNESWDRVALEAAAEYGRLAQGHGVTPDEGLVDELLDFDEGRSRSATVEVRVNQARFRKAVLASYNATCCISGLRHEKLVIASHIVPWSEDTQNRLNPQNGLCLSALHDRAYDQGLITVMPDFTVRTSSSLRAGARSDFMATSLLRFDMQPIHMPDRFRPAPEFLARHARRFGFIA